MIRGLLFDVPTPAIDACVGTNPISVLDTGRDFASGKGRYRYIIENHGHY
jgi:hypothetical protein